MKALAAVCRRVNGGNRLQLLRVGQPTAQELRVPAHDHQQIIEIVSDAACQLSERFHLLRLGKLFLRPFQRYLRFPSFGNVARDLREADERPRLITDGFDNNACPEKAFVAS